jgi:hypothetical protein
MLQCSVRCSVGLSTIVSASRDAIDLLLVVMENFMLRLANYAGDDDAKAYRAWLATNPPTIPASP